METILFLAAIVIAFLVFTWLVRVVRVTVNAAITIALLVLALQLLFGIGPEAVWQQLQALVNGVLELFRG
jgi:hypothetical protein